MIFNLEIGAAILGLGVALTIVLIFVIIRDRRQGTQINDQQYSRASSEIQKYSQPAYQPPSHQETATLKSQTTSKLCTDCGEINEDNAKFCVICGQKL